MVHHCHHKEPVWSQLSLIDHLFMENMSKVFGRLFCTLCRRSLAGQNHWAGPCIWFTIEYRMNAINFSFLWDRLEPPVEERTAFERIRSLVLSPPSCRCCCFTCRLCGVHLVKKGPHWICTRSNFWLIIVLLTFVFLPVDRHGKMHRLLRCLHCRLRSRESRPRSRHWLSSFPTVGPAVYHHTAAHFQTLHAGSPSPSAARLSWSWWTTRGAVGRRAASCAWAAARLIIWNKCAYKSRTHCGPAGSHMIFPSHWVVSVAGHQGDTAFGERSFVSADRFTGSKPITVFVFLQVRGILFYPAIHRFERFYWTTTSGNDCTWVGSNVFFPNKTILSSPSINPHQPPARHIYGFPEKGSSQDDFILIGIQPIFVHALYLHSEKKRKFAWMCQPPPSV